MGRTLGCSVWLIPYLICLEEVLFSVLNQLSNYTNVSPYLIDLCTLDANSVQFRPSIIAASALWLILPNQLQEVTGYTWEDLIAARNWMQPYAKTLKSYPAQQVRSFTGIEERDRHNIQTHFNVGLRLLAEVWKAQDEEEPLTPESDSDVENEEKSVVTQKTLNIFEVFEVDFKNFKNSKLLLYAISDYYYTCLGNAKKVFKNYEINFFGITPFLPVSQNTNFFPARVDARRASTRYDRFSTCAKKIIKGLEISDLKYTDFGSARSQIAVRAHSQYKALAVDQITLHGIVWCDCERRQISSFISDRLAGKHSIMKHNAIIILVYEGSSEKNMDTKIISGPKRYEFLKFLKFSTLSFFMKFLKSTSKTSKTSAAPPPFSFQNIKSYFVTRYMATPTSKPGPHKSPSASPKSRHNLPETPSSSSHRRDTHSNPDLVTSLGERVSVTKLKSGWPLNRGSLNRGLTVYHCLSINHLLLVVDSSYTKYLFQVKMIHHSDEKTQIKVFDKYLMSSVSI
eukprot:sb/3463943/